MEELQGYRGLPLEILRKAGVKVGDMVRVQKDDYIVEGLLMPRIELGDPNHLVIKLANGYNVGIKVSSQTKVEKIFVEEKPSTATVEFKVE
ncbi:Glu-tRNA(Gln) amidotransferase GatDE subunit D, partial [Candidatus Bathyarchaeota archaeon]